MVSCPVVSGRVAQFNVGNNVPQYTLFTIEIVDFASAAMNFRKEATARILELEGA